MQGNKYPHDMSVSDMALPTEANCRDKALLSIKPGSVRVMARSSNGRMCGS